MLDNNTGHIFTTSKPLIDEGELELSFDEWHQAWHCLLQLIKTFILAEFHMWEANYTMILNSENRAEIWPLYVAYDIEICKKAMQSELDLSVFFVSVWNNLEACYMAKKVLSLVQSNLTSQPAPSNNNQIYFHNPSKGSSSRTYQHSSTDSAKTGCCIFCSDFSKAHLSRNCMALSNTNETPCHLSRHEPTRSHHSKSGKRYCYLCSGPSGCNQTPCC
jgi:hypothetical protein